MGKIEVTLDAIQELDDARQGLCVWCGAVREFCEPDAYQYDCEACGGRTVYGAENLVLMGLVVVAG